MLPQLGQFEDEFEYELERELEYEEELAMEPGGEYAVIGPRDDRFHIPARNIRPGTRLFPFNTISLLEQFVPGRGWRSLGTGTLIAPQVVLTAKHVLMRLRGVRNPCRRIRRSGPWRPRIRVSPGAGRTPDGRSIIRPASPQSIIATSTRFRVHPNLDYGVIILPTPFRSPNRFMMLQPRGAPRSATLLTIAGYPCDKLPASMWGHSERIPLQNVGPEHLTYTIDTCAGHSGSPIWLLGNANIRLLLGIHTNGAAQCDNDPARGAQCRPTGAPVTPVRGTNCGVRVTCAVIDTIEGWCRQFGVTGPIVDRVQYRRACARR
jgi:V8-like Glu-specific endopeptidase